MKHQRADGYGFDSADYPQVQLDPEHNLDAIVAVWNGEIEGDYYSSDDTTWASVKGLEAWKAKSRGFQ